MLNTDNLMLSLLILLLLGTVSTGQEIKDGWMTFGTEEVSSVEVTFEKHGNGFNDTDLYRVEFGKDSFNQPAGPNPNGNSNQAATYTGDLRYQGRLRLRAQHYNGWSYTLTKTEDKTDKTKPGFANGVTRTIKFDVSHSAVHGKITVKIVSFPRPVRFGTPTQFGVEDLPARKLNLALRVWGLYGLRPVRPDVKAGTTNKRFTIYTTTKGSLPTFLLLAPAGTPFRGE